MGIVKIILIAVLWSPEGITINTMSEHYSLPSCEAAQLKAVDKLIKSGLNLSQIKVLCLAANREA